MTHAVWFLLAGTIAGMALGFVGAGGPMIGLPIILVGTALSAHSALGTNAAAMATLSTILAVWTVTRSDSNWREALFLALPGLVGAYFGTRAGLVFPGHKLISILGIVVFAAAAWMLWLSSREEPLFSAPPSPEPQHLRRRAYWLVPCGLVIGWISGFFAVAGGFMIVIALMLGGKLPVRLASQAALIPIALFTGLEAAQYAAAGHVDLAGAGLMLATGLVMGALGNAMARKTPRHLLQRALAGLFVLVGAYFLIR